MNHMQNKLSSMWSAVLIFPWQYGKCRDLDSRRNRITGEVQFSRYSQFSDQHMWLTFDRYWWPEFKPNKTPDE